MYFGEIIVLAVVIVCLHGLYDLAMIYIERFNHRVEDVEHVDD